jgi:flagellar hook assembly protein FlgD
MKRVWNEETTSYPLIDGTYTATLSITDVLGNNPSSRSIAVTVSNARPTVYAWMSYYSFSPSAGQVTGLYYSLSESCYVTVRFYNSAGSSMRTLLNNALIPSGEHSLIWDGRSSTGAIVPLGDYRVRLYATDTSGNRATPYYPITILVTVT